MAITDDKESLISQWVKDTPACIRSLCGSIIALTITATTCCLLLNVNVNDYLSPKPNDIDVFTSAFVQLRDAMHSTAKGNKDLEQLVLDLQDQLETQRLEILHLQQLSHNPGNKNDS